jgi:alpha-beta hydrolase superfamily lysophospholipase
MQQPKTKTTSRPAFTLLLSLALGAANCWQHPACTGAIADNNDSPHGATSVELLAGKPPLLKWQAEGTAKGVVLCLHELGMYAGVFEDVGKRLSHNGYTVYAMDERGFGGWDKVKGPEGKMNLDKTLSDIKDACTELKKKENDLPIFILGEAMGGALALKAASTFPDLIQGTISSTPGGEHFHTTHNYMTVCRHLITQPNKRFDMGKSLLVSATPRTDLQNYIRSDQEIRLNLTPKELMSCQFFMYKSKDFAKKITNTPVMIVQGQKDGETKPQSSQKVYESLSTRDKKILPVTDGDHYVYEDQHVDDQAMNATVSWLDEHLSKTSAPPAKPQS